MHSLQTERLYFKLSWLNLKSVDLLQGQINFKFEILYHWIETYLEWVN